MDWLEDNQEAKIKAVQGYDLNHSSNVVSYFVYASATTIRLYSVKLDTGALQYETWTVTSDYGTTLDDAVNKIN